MAAHVSTIKIDKSAIRLDKLGLKPQSSSIEVYDQLREIEQSIFFKAEANKNPNKLSDRYLFDSFFKNNEKKN
jgi:hypothetical protein